MKINNFGRIAYLLVLILIPYFQCKCMSNKKSNGENILSWYSTLPICPCQNPDKNSLQLNDSWAKDKGDIAKFHKGANECFRSYPPMQTNEGESCQQCCYDKDGNLITNGSGAGTPDKMSTCSGEDKKGIMTTRVLGLLGHYQKDVKPWFDMGGQDSGWIKYNLLWKPNNGNYTTERKKR